MKSFIATLLIDRFICFSCSSPRVMLPAHTQNLFQRSLLQRAHQLFIVNFYSNFQMICTLMNESDDKLLCVGQCFFFSRNIG